MLRPVGAWAYQGDAQKKGTHTERGEFSVDLAIRPVSNARSGERGEVDLRRVKRARVIFWNGPMGVFEKEAFAKGTMAMARAVAESDAISVVGGGESVEAVKESGFADEISHISTGGGASLELLEQGDLPGLAALRGEWNGT